MFPFRKSNDQSLTEIEARLRKTLEGMQSAGSSPVYDDGTLNRALIIDSLEYKALKTQSDHTRDRENAYIVPLSAARAQALAMRRVAMHLRISEQEKTTASLIGTPFATAPIVDSILSCAENVCFDGAEMNPSTPSSRLFNRAVEDAVATDKLVTPTRPTTVPRLSGSTPSRLSGSTPSRMTGSTPSRLSGSTPSRLSGSTPSRLSGSTPSRLSGSTPSRMSGSTPPLTGSSTPPRLAGSSPRSPRGSGGDLPLPVASPTRSPVRLQTTASTRSPKAVEEQSLPSPLIASPSTRSPSPLRSPAPVPTRSPAKVPQEVPALSSPVKKASPFVIPTSRTPSPQRTPSKRAAPFSTDDIMQADLPKVESPPSPLVTPSRRKIQTYASMHSSPERTLAKIADVSDEVATLAEERAEKAVVEAIRDPTPQKVNAAEVATARTEAANARAEAASDRAASFDSDLADNWADSLGLPPFKPAAAIAAASRSPSRSPAISPAAAIAAASRSPTRSPSTSLSTMASEAGAYIDDITSNTEKNAITCKSGSPRKMSLSVDKKRVSSRGTSYKAADSDALSRASQIRTAIIDADAFAVSGHARLQSDSATLIGVYTGTIGSARSSLTRALADVGVVEHAKSSSESVVHGSRGAPDVHILLFTPTEFIPAFVKYFGSETLQRRLEKFAKTSDLEFSDGELVDPSGDVFLIEDLFQLEQLFKSARLQMPARVTASNVIVIDKESGYDYHTQCAA